MSINRPVAPKKDSTGRVVAKKASEPPQHAQTAEIPLQDTFAQIHRRLGNRRVTTLLRGQNHAEIARLPLTTGDPKMIVQLQRTLGNRAVLQRLQDESAIATVITSASPNDYVHRAFWDKLFSRNRQVTDLPTLDDEGRERSDTQFSPLPLPDVVGSSDEGRERSGTQFSPLPLPDVAGSSASTQPSVAPPPDVVGSSDEGRERSGTQFNPLPLPDVAGSSASTQPSVAPPPDVVGSSASTSSSPMQVPALDPKSKKAKAQKYFDRAQQLYLQQKFLGAAVLFTRAFNFDQDAALAENAAFCFYLSGDRERAVHWARQTLALDPGIVRAREILHQYQATDRAKYQHTKMAGSTYTQPSKKALEGAGVKDKSERQAIKSSGMSLEEYSPKQSVATPMDDAIGRLFNESDKNKDWFIRILEYKVGVGAKGIGVQGSEYDAEVLAKEAPIYFFHHIAHKNYDLNFLVWKAKQKGIDTTPQDILNGNMPQLEKLMTRTVEYINHSADRAQFVLHPKNGKIVQGDPNSDEPYSTANSSTNFSGKGYAIFVMDEDGQIYASSHMMSQFHHSSFLGSGMPTAAAGEIKVEDGKLTEISNKSGHFKPSPFQLVQALQEFRTRFGQTDAKVKVFEGRHNPREFTSISEFLDHYRTP